MSRAKASLDLPRKSNASSRTPASGMLRRGHFCEATQRRHFPRTEEAVLACSSFFATGRTFLVYVALLGKARLLFGLDTKWKTKTATTVGHGLRPAWRLIRHSTFNGFDFSAKDTLRKPPAHETEGGRRHVFGKTP